MAEAVVVDKKDINYLNKITKNYPNNALRPLEISQATYEALLMVFMNDMGGDKYFWQYADDKANNEYMKALGTFILGEPLGEHLWPKNWLVLLHEEFEDVKSWTTALYLKAVAEGEKMFVGNILQAMLKRTVTISSLPFIQFLAGKNPVEKKYANKEAGSQKAFPSSLTTRRVLEPLIIPYRKTGMYGDCTPSSPVNNLDSLKKYFADNLVNASGTIVTTKFSQAFTSSMIDFYKSNIFPDPELFLPYMIALSPSLRNAQLAIEEYESFAKLVSKIDYNDCCDPFLTYLTGKKIPAIPNFEKNYLLLIEKFNFNRDYMKISVGPIIQNMVLPLAIKFGVFSTDGNAKDRREKRATAQRENAHSLFTLKETGPDYIREWFGSIVKFWHAHFRSMTFSYQNPKLMYFPHWLFACSSRYVRADIAMRDRDFVVVNVESIKKRAYIVRWCNIKNFLTRDACNLAVLLSKTGEKVEQMHIMAFQDYIQMIPRPEGVLALTPTETASFTNCFEKVCSPQQNQPCFPTTPGSILPPSLP